MIIGLGNQSEKILGVVISSHMSKKHSWADETNKTYYTIVCNVNFFNVITLIKFLHVMLGNNCVLNYTCVL